MSSIVKNCSWDRYCGSNELEASDLPDIGLGVVAGVGFYAAVNAAMDFFANNALIIGNEGVKDVLLEMSNISSGGNFLFKVAIKICFFVYAVLIGPWLEETIFRGVFHEFLESELGKITEKVSRVVLNGLVFGFCHIFPISGAFSLSVFMIPVALGMLCAALRMWREDRVACTSAHMVYNSLVFLPLMA